MKHWFGPVVVVVVTACSSAGPQVTSARVNALYPSKGDACAVRFENLTFQEAASKYEHIGLITVDSESSEFSEPIKRAVEREACHMGADAVALNVSVSNVLQFSAWRAR